MQSPISAARRLATRAAAASAAIVIAVAFVSCGTFSSTTAALPSLPQATSTFQMGLVPGNSATAPLPTDAPKAVSSRTDLPSCGAENQFEEDPDVSPLPTAPWPTTSDADNTQANNCLISAWENGRQAELSVSLISDEADEIYTIYRLPGTGALELIVRVRSSSDKTVTWTQTTCKELSLQGDELTPSDCQLETPVQ
jgi:hypothetical protein